MVDSKSRVVVITGANKGIGFELAKLLLKNANKPVIVITSRNESLGKTALKELSEQNPDSKDSLHYHVLDITKKETYAPFSDWIKATFGRIDVLVNNAGVATENELSPDYKASLTDTQRVIGTNYLSTREFTEYIYPLLSADGKIINVSSTLGTYRLQGKTLQQKFNSTKLTAKDLEEIYELFVDTVKKQNFTEADIPGSSYKVSKALMNSWTYHILKDSLKGDQQAFSMCPGWCRTDLGGQNATKSAEEGPLTIEYLIDLPFKLNKDINGKFFRDNGVVDFN